MKQDKRRRIEEVHVWLQQMQSKCVYCFWRDRMSRAHTSIFNCLEPETQNTKLLYQTIKNRIRQSRAIADFARCSFCFVP